MRDRYDAQLGEIRDAGLWRTHQVRDSHQSRTVTYEGVDYLNFNSNDYLGLSADPRLMEAAIAGMQQYGLGSGAANTLSGYTRAHAALCEALAIWLKRDKVLLFTSGYQANLAMLTSLITTKDFIWADKHNHASLIDGMRMTGARFKRYPHLSCPPIAIPNPFILTESIFSMEGDAADLAGLHETAQRHSATLLVDEAHAFGLYGAQGQGRVFEAGLSQDDVPVIMGTFGKAFGVSGAMLAGRATEMDMIMQTARAYLFTTAISPMVASAVLCALDCVKKADQERAHLFALIQSFREGMAKLSLTLCDSHSPIQSVLFDSIETTQAVGNALKEKGIWVPVIRYPTVPKESPRLRFTLTALHTKADVVRLLTVLDEVCRVVCR